MADITGQDVSLGLGIFSGINSLGNDAANRIVAKATQDANNAQIRRDSQKMFERLSERANQIESDAANAMLDNQGSMLAQQEAAKVVASSTGQAGQSVSSMLQDIAVAGGNNQADIIKQRERALQEITYQAEDVRRGARDGMRNRQFNKPSLTKALQTGIGVYNTSSEFAKLLNDYQGG